MWQAVTPDIYKLIDFLLLTQRLCTRAHDRNATIYIHRNSPAFAGLKVVSYSWRIYTRLLRGSCAWPLQSYLLDHSRLSVQSDYRGSLLSPLPLCAIRMVIA